MRRFARLLLALSILLPATVLWGQQAEKPSDSEPLARLAYDTTAVTQRGDLTHVCLAITRDGGYQIMRSTNEEPTQYLRGQMSKDHFQQLKSLLSSKEFRTQSGIWAGLIRQDSESFRAEMPIPLRKRADGTYILPPSEAWRLEWLNADDAAPFPDSIAKVVNWLQNFQPKNGKEFSYTEFPNVCPSGGMRLIQPTIATNDQH
ncbi:MAG: hypothetical protein WA477_16235 [Candidatus Sulfotelmatobacter sp.]